MQLSLFEMVKHGTSTIIEIVDSFARTKIDELNVSLNAKQNIRDDALTTTDKTIVGAINEVNGKAEDNTDAISQINSDLSELKTMIDKSGDCHFTNVTNDSRWRCSIIPISDDNALCVLKATLTPTDTTITYTIPQSSYGANINAVMYGLFGTENNAIDLGRGSGTAGEMYTGTRTRLTANADYVIDTCYIVGFNKSQLKDSYKIINNRW